MKAARQWRTTFHEDLTHLRKETRALREDVREFSGLVGSLHQEIVNLRAELTHLQEDREGALTEEDVKL